MPTYLPTFLPTGSPCFKFLLILFVQGDQFHKNSIHIEALDTIDHLPWMDQQAIHHRHAQSQQTAA